VWGLCVTMSFFSHWLDTICTPAYNENVALAIN
jgi:hypothetical protein